MRNLSSTKSAIQRSRSPLGLQQSEDPGGSGLGIWCSSPVKPADTQSPGKSADVREQTQYALQRVKMILELRDDVLTVLTHLTRREDLAAYNEEYAKFFPSNKPARTTVEVMLNAPELLVEITVTACNPD